MGALANVGGGLGSMFAGAGDATSLARNSFGWGTIATGANVAANLATGYAGKQQGDYAAKVAGRNATTDLLAGQYAEGVEKGKTTRLVAEQKAAQAANGVEVGSKSAEAVRNATANVGALDAAMIHYNAMRAAFGEAQDAALARKAGQGALAQGLGKANASFLAGASSLSDKWLLYKRTGAI